MNPFYLILVLISAMSLPAVIYGQQKVQQSSRLVTKTYTDTLLVNYSSMGNFSKKELMKMEAVKWYASPVKTKAIAATGNLSAKEQMKNGVVNYNASTTGKLLLPASVLSQNLSLKEKMKMAVVYNSFSFLLHP